MERTLLVGGSLLVVGTVLTVHHSLRLFKGKWVDRKSVEADIWSHLPFIIVGMWSFNIGSNLGADSHHDRLGASTV